MMWTIEQAGKLWNLCYKGVSNKEIAQELGCDIKDVYAKRSQMGITIDKCKGKKVNKEFDIDPNVEKAFKELKNALLISMAKNNTSLEDAKSYGLTFSLVVTLESHLMSEMGK